jgi:hypothetical protein
LFCPSTPEASGQDDKTKGCRFHRGYGLSIWQASVKYLKIRKMKSCLSEASSFHLGLKIVLTAEEAKP